VNIVRLRSWKEFKHKVVDAYHSKDANARKLFWFRGHGDAAWPLITTLDRFRRFSSDPDRIDFYRELLAAFRHEMIGLRHFQNLESEPLELLARHHGLPSPLLDWTESPYIAAFFAFAEQYGEEAAIFALNRIRLPGTSDFSAINDRELLQYNDRAIEQKGVFLRVNSIRMASEKLMGDALTKYVLSHSDRELAMSDLGSMGITMRNLFRDLDGAARSAKILVAIDQPEA
jgi:hypothetical protein